MASEADYHYEIQRYYPSDASWHTVHERVRRDGRDLSLEETRDYLKVMSMGSDARYRIRRVSYEVVQ